MWVSCSAATWTSSKCNRSARKTGHHWLPPNFKGNTFYTRMWNVHRALSHLCCLRRKRACVDILGDVPDGGRSSVCWRTAICKPREFPHRSSCTWHFTGHLASQLAGWVHVACAVCRPLLKKFQWTKYFLVIYSSGWTCSSWVSEWRLWPCWAALHPTVATWSN